MVLTDGDAIYCCPTCESLFYDSEDFFYHMAECDWDDEWEGEDE